MERAGKVLGKLSAARELARPEVLAKSAWKSAVGKKVANHTSGLRLWQGTLTVDVEDVIWQRQLTTLQGQIMHRLAEVLGAGVVRKLEFRVRLPRKGVQSAAPVSTDEADGIDDPLLRRLYVASRTRQLKQRNTA